MGMKNLAQMSRGANNGFDDKVYTPKHIVDDILEWVKPYGKILEPFRGDGAFYEPLVNYQYNNELTTDVIDWSEIDMGKDFFEINKHYDFIITNPPYSIFTQVLEKSFEISDNVILLIPHMKVFSSDKRLNMIAKYGEYECKRFKNPKEWKNNFPIGAYWFKKIKDNNNVIIK